MKKILIFLVLAIVLISCNLEQNMEQNEGGDQLQNHQSRRGQNVSSPSTRAAGTVALSLWFKTPGDKYETNGDGSNGSGDEYYYNPNRPVDSYPKCVNPEGFKMPDYNNSIGYYQYGGLFQLWHGRMRAMLSCKSPYLFKECIADDNGDIWVTDLPEGFYWVNARAPLVAAYMDTKSGHRGWFSGADSQFDMVEYYDQMILTPEPDNSLYECYQWYDAWSWDYPGPWNGPYFQGFQFHEKYVEMDVRINGFSCLQRDIHWLY